MSDLTLERTELRLPDARQQRATAPRRACAVSLRIEDRQYAVMEEAFRLSGGIADSDRVARLVRSHCDQPISIVAHWILTRQAVSFVWRSRMMLPLFQFDLATMRLRPEATSVFAELSDVFDGWDLALWFAEPNCWLSDVAPVDVLRVDACGVYEAARADRFVARG
jgi:GAF domain-containing protein